MGAFGTFEGYYLASKGVIASSSFLKSKFGVF